MIQDFIVVGKIVNTHGIKGEVRVIAQTDYPTERFKPSNVMTWKSGHDDQLKSLTIATHRVHKSFELIRFEGYPTINEVEVLVGGQLIIESDQLFDLEEDEFYVHDIIGITILDEAYQVIGTVKEVIRSGANDVWVVKRPKKVDLMLPYIDEVIKKVDLNTQEVIVHVLEGLDDAS